MKELAQWLRTQVLANSTITDIIGSRYYADLVPETLDRSTLVYSIANVPEELSKDTLRTYREYDVLFESFSLLKEETFDVCDALYDMFHRLATTESGNLTINGVYIIDGGSGIAGEEAIFKQWIEFRFRVNK